MSIFTPINQVKLTNVSVVRLKKNGQRFELACYPNKVQEYRQKITIDLGEILQTPSIFTNVSKGQLARSCELDSAFDTTDTKPIIKEILEKGDIQVSGLERKQALDSRLKEVATIIANKVVDSSSKMPFPVGLIEQALVEHHFNPNMTRTGKQQAIEWIKILQSKGIPIERTLMRIQIRNNNAVDDEFDKELLNLLTRIESEQKGEIIATIEPEVFRQINQLASKNPNLVVQLL